jgi:hypothetical protein
VSTRIIVALAISVLLIGTPTPGKDHPDERLKDVTAVFVTGNNQAAEGARQILENGKTCLSLAAKAADADAVLDVTADSQSQGGPMGGMGGRAWIASGTLTLKSGNLVWSRSARSPDAPMMSGGKTAGSLLVRYLAVSAGCKNRGSR